MPNWYQSLRSAVGYPSQPGNQQTPDLIKLKEHNYDPKNKTQTELIEKKLKEYRNNYETMLNEIWSTLWPTPTVLALYRYVPWVFGYLAAATALAAEVLFFNPATLIPDIASRYPQHFKNLHELAAIADWMKDVGIAVTHDPLFIEVMREIAPLIPLQKIPFWNLTDSQYKEVDKKYLEVLFQYPHRLLTPMAAAVENNQDAEQNRRRMAAENSSLLTATIRYRFFGLSTGEEIAKAKEAGMNVYNSLPRRG